MGAQFRRLPGLGSGKASLSTTSRKDAGDHRSAFLACAAHGERGADFRGAIIHAFQAHSAYFGKVAWNSDPVIPDGEFDPFGGIEQTDRDRLGLAVLSRVVD